MTLLYTPQLLNRLVARGAGDTPAARQCRRSAEDEAAPLALLVESWIDQFDPPGKLRSEIVGPDPIQFWSAVAELRTAALLSGLGFEVSMRTAFDGLAPDLVAEKDGRRVVVEVFALSDDAKSQAESSLYSETSERLTRKLQLSPGLFVSCFVLAPKSGPVPEPVLEQLAAGIRGAVEAGRETYDVMEGNSTFRCHIHPADEDEETWASLRPISTTSSSQAPRLRARTNEKIAKYAHLASPELLLTVAVNAMGMKVSEYGLQTALLGREVVRLDARGPAHEEVFFEGAGPFGEQDEASRALSGHWYLDHGVYADVPPANHFKYSFLHNPFARHPLPQQLLGETEQLLHVEGGMRWHRYIGGGSAQLTP